MQSQSEFSNHGEESNLVRQRIDQLRAEAKGDDKLLKINAILEYKRLYETNSAIAPHAKAAILMLCREDIGKLNKDDKQYVKNLWVLMDLYLNCDFALNTIGVELTKYIQAAIKDANKFKLLIDIFRKQSYTDLRKLRLQDQYACYTFTKLLSEKEVTQKNLSLFANQILIPSSYIIIVNWLFAAYLKPESTSTERQNYLIQLNFIAVNADTKTNFAMKERAQQVLAIIKKREQPSGMLGLSAQFYLEASCSLVLPEHKNAKLEEWSKKDNEGIPSSELKLHIDFKQLAQWYLKIIPIARTKANPFEFILWCGWYIQYSNIHKIFKKGIAEVLSLNDGWWLERVGFRVNNLLLEEILPANRAAFANINHNIGYHFFPSLYRENDDGRDKFSNQFHQVLIFIHELLTSGKFGDDAILKNIMAIIDEYHIKFKDMNGKPILRESASDYEAQCVKTLQIIKQMVKDELSERTEKKERDNLPDTQLLDCLSEIDLTADDLLMRLKTLLDPGLALNSDLNPDFEAAAGAAPEAAADPDSVRSNSSYKGAGPGPGQRT